MSDKEPDGTWNDALSEHVANPPSPAVVGNIIMAFGETWRVSVLENRIKAQFEQWLHDNALRRIGKIESETHPDTTRKIMGSYIADCSAESYSWDGNACRLALSDIPGMKHLFYLLLKRAHPSMTKDKSSAIFKASTGAAVRAIEWSVGNEKPPAETTGGRKKAEDNPEPPGESTETLD